jgi:DNA (cytosine-5)-methyltransferase 1
MEIKFIDLFAGIGGFHHALTTIPSIKGECVLTCEMDASCRKVYEANFGRQNNFSDNIRKLTQNKEGESLSKKEIRDNVPGHNILCAGFPCQPFSKSGKQHGAKDKTRGTLFHDIISIAEAREPEYLILENVKNLMGPKHKKTLEVILDAISELGYDVEKEPITLSPHQLSKELDGAPQVRDRVFILAIKKSLKNLAKLQTISKEVKALKGTAKHSQDSWRISEYLVPDSSIKGGAQRYRLNKQELAWLEAWDEFVKIIPDDKLPGFPIWCEVFKKSPPATKDLPKWKINFLKKNHDFYKKHESLINSWMEKHGVKSFPASRQKFEWQAKKSHKVRKGRTIKDLVIQMRPSGIRVKPATYLPALVAITQTSIIGPLVAPSKVKEYRSLTPQEAAKLQGMPTDIFSKDGGKVADTVAFKQLGNAVNVGVVRYLASKLIT